MDIHGFSIFLKNFEGVFLHVMRVGDKVQDLARLSMDCLAHNKKVLLLLLDTV